MAGLRDAVLKIVARMKARAEPSPRFREVLEPFIDLLEVACEAADNQGGSFLDKPMSEHKVAAFHRVMVEKARAEATTKRTAAEAQEQVEAPRVAFLDGPLEGEYAPMDAAAPVGCKVPVGGNVYVLDVRSGTRVLVFSKEETVKLREKMNAPRLDV